MSYQLDQESQPLLGQQQKTDNQPSLLGQQQQQQAAHHHSHSHGNHGHSHSHSPSQPDMSQVRDAFERRDILQSIELHNQRAQIVSESHDQAAYQAHFVGQISATIHGILTTMIIVQISFSAQLGYRTMFTLVLSALAMAFGFASNEVLQIISERLFVEGEASREQWELEVNLQGEVDEMVALYLEKGVPLSVAKEIWGSYAKDPKVFLEAMMAAEIGVIYPIPPFDGKKVLKNRFFAFILGALVPMIPMILLMPLKNWIWFDTSFHTVVSLLVSLAALFVLGSKRNKGYPVTSESEALMLNNGLQSLFCGALCAAIAFLVGHVPDFLP